jgi:hypothetical protein
MLLMATAEFTAKLTDWVELAVPTGWLANVRLLGLTLAAGGMTVPVPMSVTLCGLPPAVLLITRLAPRLPAALGVKRIPILRLPGPKLPAAPPKTIAKSPASPPAIVTPLIVTAALTVKLADWVELVAPTGWPANMRMLGLTVAVAGIPVPLRETVCGLPLAVLAIINWAVRFPRAVGVKRTPMLRLPGPKPPVFPPNAIVKSLAFAPAIVTLLIVTAAFTEKLTDSVVLVVPTGWSGKLRLAGLTLAVAGEAPVTANDASPATSWLRVKTMW